MEPDRVDPEHPEVVEIGLEGADNGLSAVKVLIRATILLLLLLTAVAVYNLL
jgi:hypothetical protein